MSYFDYNLAGGGVPGHAGEQRARGLRAGGAEGDGSVLLCADRKAAARQVEPSRDDVPARSFGSGRHNLSCLHPLCLKKALTGRL